MNFNRASFFNSYLIATLSTAFLTACSLSSQDAQKASVELDYLQGLYSTRPTVEEPVIFILKLSEPALLESAARKDGKLVIDKKLLAAQQAEQNATIEKLKSISPDIQILIRYRSVLNGFAVWAPADTLDKIQALPNVTMSERATTFHRIQDEAITPTTSFGDRTSVKFIGGNIAHAQNIRGQGLRVGVIDTGVDYTHKMLGGPGTADAYKSVNPAETNSLFPNDKVVGGIDLVGSEYNAASPDYKKRIPVPDSNPIDEATHGTHVAGTIAGLGDGQNTYDGVAPNASLYAIKVFGAKGSTSDEIVIAALEYAADPHGDLSFNSQLDVVNLSLGSGYGNPHIMYNHAIKNLVRGGTTVVASGGNSGDQSFIVGAPGVADDAISVASSVDNSNQNVLFPAIEFTAGESHILAEAIEASFSKKLAEFSVLEGEVIYAGFADQDFDDTMKNLINGKVALIDRGKVNFTEKVRRAQEAGALAVVVANNAEGAPFIMGGDGKFDIPAVMIDLPQGAQIKELLQNQTLVVNLKSKSQIEKPWLVDTISSFSSRGPRSEDGFIKPEITAPGTNIISAGSGSGDKGISMSGTSMAGPHIAGVMALLKQKYPDLSPYELKSVLLANGKIISDVEKTIYPVSRQGAGRVQIDKSLNAKIVTIPATLSFGISDIEKQKTLAKEITIKNISAETLNLRSEWSGSAGFEVSMPAITLNPGESKKILVTGKLISAQIKSANEELDGFLQLMADEESLVQMPALLLTRNISRIEASSLVVQASSEDDSAGSLVNLTLKNKSMNPGSAYLFNMLGSDARKSAKKPDLAHNRNCDLQSAGYRVIEKDGKQILQFAIKLYEGMTTWHRCELNIQLDANGDGLADQELGGFVASDLAGLNASDFASILLDGNKAREIRKKYEKDFSEAPEKASENYSSAVVDIRPMQIFDNSTLAIVEAEINLLSFAPTGELNIKVSTTHNDNGAVEYDDYLANQEKKWKKISVDTMGQAFSKIPEVINLEGSLTADVSFIKGYGSESLILYAPQNKSVRDSLRTDKQSQVISLTYAVLH